MFSSMLGSHMVAFGNYAGLLFPTEPAQVVPANSTDCRWEVYRLSCLLHLVVLKVSRPVVWPGILSRFLI